MTLAAIQINLKYNLELIDLVANASKAATPDQFSHLQFLVSARRKHQDSFDFATANNFGDRITEFCNMILN